MNYLRITLLLSAVLALVTPAEATKYWYGGGGSDSNSCGSISGTSDPGLYRTWAGTWACMHASDTFHIKAGSYIKEIYEGPNPQSGQVAIVVPNGTAGNPTIIEGEGAGGCALASTCNTILAMDGHNIEDPQYITIRNLRIFGNNQTGNPCLSFRGTGHDIIVDNVELDTCWQHGVQTQSDVNKLTMRNFNIHHTNQSAGHISGHGCYLAGDDTLLENFMIHDITLGTNVLGCQLYDSGIHNTADRAIVRNGAVFSITTSTAIYIAGDNAQVYNMLFYGSQRGVEISPGNESDGGCNTGGKVYNNVFYGNTLAMQFGNNFGSGICSNLTVDLTNNIIIGNTRAVDFGAGRWSSTGTKNMGNCGSTCGTSPISLSAITDVTISTSDFHLKSVTNAAVDTGINLSGIVSTDKDGVPRCQGAAFDIGPYEWLFASPPPTPSGGCLRPR